MQVLIQQWAIAALGPRGVNLPLRKKFRAIFPPNQLFRQKHCTAALSPFLGPVVHFGSRLPRLVEIGKVKSTPMSRKGLRGLKAGWVPSKTQVPVCRFTAGKMGLPVVSAAHSFSSNLCPSSTVHIGTAFQPQRPPGSSLPLQSLPALGTLLPCPGGDNETWQKETAFCR